MTDTTSSGDLSPTGMKSPKPSRGPLQWLVDFFSSVWLGVWLLAILFVYCAVGSAGIWIPLDLGLSYHHDWIHDIYWMHIQWTQIHVRQSPWLELTEFEWFHWWPFDLLIALICINIVVATVRRVPLKVVNLGAWLIHAGVVILCIGSVMYFGSKLEGDTPILRRNLVIEVPNHPPVRISAQPGNSISLADDRYRFQIMDIDPEWELLSGGDKGTKAYTVMVAVHSPEHQYVRTLPAGYPEHVQDAIFTNDPEQPLVRAINHIGKPIVDESVKLSLEYASSEHFYLMDSAAIYLREQGSPQWIERPIKKLPRYNDYLQSATQAWMPRRSLLQEGTVGPVFTPRPLHIEVPSVDPDDPLAGVPIYVDRYLRYAFEHTRRMPGGDRFDPMVRLRLRSVRGAVQDHELVAFDPGRNHAESGRLQFVAIGSERALAELTVIQQPMLEITVPEAGVSTRVPAIASQGGDDAFTAIEGTDYAYSIVSMQNNLSLRSGELVSVAIVRIRTPERTFQRWVFDKLAARDLSEANTAMHEQELEFDDRIQMRYFPGRMPAAPVTIVAGPGEDQLHLLLALEGQEPRVAPLQPREVVDVQPGITLELLSYVPYSRDETRPQIVAPEQREPNVGNQRSMIHIEIPWDGGHAMWLRHHVYPFAHEHEVLRGFPYQPKEIRLSDGRVIEVMYSRQSRPLPAAIALDDFLVTTHIGGFTGQTSSIRDWTSMICFDEGGTWMQPTPVSMNKPGHYGGFWYFQAKWDPPDQPRWEGDAPSRGMNYTILGVGNRNGVWTQLFGCVVAVIGMCYAFYLKPVIKRRRQQAVYQKLAAQGAVSQGAGAAMEAGQ